MHLKNELIKILIYKILNI